MLGYSGSWLLHGSLWCKIKAPKNRCNAQPFNLAVFFSVELVWRFAYHRVSPAHTQSSWGRAVNPGKDSARRSDGAPLVRSRLVSEESLYLTQKTCVPFSITEEMGPGEARFISHSPRLAVPRLRRASPRPQHPHACLPRYADAFWCKAAAFRLFTQTLILKYSAALACSWFSI